MVVNNLSELKAEIEKRVSLALQNAVATKVEDKMVNEIYETVYTYDQVSYTRRYHASGSDIGSYFDDTDNTGLADVNNIVSTVNGCVLTVENMTLGSHYYFSFERDKKGKLIRKRRVSKNSGKPIAGVIETGIGYDVPEFILSRPFISNTRDALSNSRIILNAMKRGLSRQGLEVI